jgi:Glycosyltransferase like family
MLSVIICSVNISVLESVKKNIAATADVVHEIIVIDNSKRTYGICAAYNKGAATANYPFLCFVHEDVAFKTPGWGKIIITILSNKKTGLVGVAGGDTISMVPSTWSVPFYSNEINIIQQFKNKNKEAEHVYKTNEAITGTVKKVIALDGVFLCTRKELFREFKFDDQTFPGFHGYDVDFSLQVREKYDLVATHDILIHHFSDGTPDKTWMKSVFDFSEKWKTSLPSSVYPLTQQNFNLHHWESMQVFIKHLIRLRYSFFFILLNFFRYSFTRYFHLRRFLYTFRFIFRELKKTEST